MSKNTGPAPTAINNINTTYFTIHNQESGFQLSQQSTGLASTPATPCQTYVDRGV
jgi:hypothetical protein